MFTGIIESIGTIKELIANGSNLSFWIESPISSQLRADQSVSHNGVCLTVEEIDQNKHRVTAIAETIEKTNLSRWEAGTQVNLEQCLLLNSRLDGHLVQGHIDTAGICVDIKEKQGSWEYTIQFPNKFAPLIIEKGSICVNGISLTAFNVKKKLFNVAIIPYTFKHTTMSSLKEGDTVNLEFDVIGKYLMRSISLKEK